MSALDGSHRSVRGLTIATHGPRCRDMLDVIGSLKKGGPEMCPQLVAYNACRVFGALRMSTETRTRGIASVLRADGCVALEEEAGEGVGRG